MLDVRRSSNEPQRIDAIYVTYEGLLGPLGASQIEPCVSRLGEAGVRLAVVSFEEASDLADSTRRLAIASRLEARGLLWTPLPRHERPRLLARMVDAVRGTFAVLGLARQNRAAVVHARCFVAGLMALPAKIVFGARLVFDMQGFWPEERVELGILRPRSLLYRAVKRAEGLLLERSDEVIVRTESAKALLREHEAQERLRSRRVLEKRISVVPCCADTEAFRPRPPDRELAERYGLAASLVIGNVGSANRRYLLPEMFRFVFHLKTHRPEVRFVHLARRGSREVLLAARGAGLRDEDVLLVTPDPTEIARWLSLFRLGVFFLRPSYAAKASSSSRLGQFLASGVPVVANTGVGDLDRILAPSRCGLLLPGLTERDLSAFARQALPLLEGDRVPSETERNCRSVAVERFALEDAVRTYGAIYDALGPPPRAEAAIEAEVG
jgi:glycosyltransferase involved in cell wall biosynthesis